MSTGPWFLETSALVKLIRTEAESDALRDALSPGHTVLASALVLAELPRVVARYPAGTEDMERVAALLAALDLLEVDRGLLSSAAGFPPSSLRTLDAIHLAAAASIREELEAFVTYDHRLAAAASTAGFHVLAPA